MHPLDILPISLSLLELVENPAVKRKVPIQNHT